MLKYEKYITRKMLRNNPQVLYIFGDNIVRKGLGGQAKEMRGEPNAVGIPTKMLPSMDKSAFFSDANFELWRAHSNSAREKLLLHHQQGKLIIWPLDGIGTGRAKLETKAPLIYKALKLFETELRK